MKLSSNSTSKTLTTLAIIMCVLGAIFYAYEYYLRIAPGVMSSELKLAFSIGDKAFGYLVACYFYAYTPLQIPVGLMLDRFGPRKILTFACFLCAFGIYLFSATSHFSVALLGRFLVGFGSAFAYVGVLKIANLWLPKRYFALVAGITSALGMFGAITGTLTMTHLVDSIGWETTLYYAVAVGAVLTAMLWFIIREDVKIPEEMVSFELHGLVKMIKNPQLWINGFIGCLTFLPLLVFADWGVEYLKAIGLTKQEAARGLSMVYLGFAVGGPFWGWFSDQYKSRRIPLMLGSSMSALLMMVIIFMPSPSTLWMYSLLFSMAFFTGAEILIFAVGNDLSPSALSATTAAFMNTLTMVGGFTLPPIIGEWLDKSVQLSAEGLPMISLHDYTLTFIVLPISLAIAAVLSFILKETYHGVAH